MCGRFTQHHNMGDVAVRFGATQFLFEQTQFVAAPRYNIAPSQPVQVVVTQAESEERFVDAFQWGLIPSWAKDPAIGSKMINARAETVAEKPSFKRALARRRCILSADGFYEWDKSGPVRQPVYFRRTDGDLFGFAGLWEEWDAPDGSPLRTCTIITTQANETVGRIHERMPVILSRANEEIWLDESIHDGEMVLPLLVPYPDAEMESFVVSRRVNAPTTDDPDLILAENQNSA